MDATAADAPSPGAPPRCYTIVIYDHHIWWSYMMIRYDYHIWWSYMTIIYDDHIWCKNSRIKKNTDSLAPKENSPSENSPAHGNTKIGVFRAIGIFWEERFTFLSHMWQDIFQGLYSGKIVWKVFVFWKIPVHEWGRRESWWAHTLGNGSYGLDLVF